MQKLLRVWMVTAMLALPLAQFAAEPANLDLAKDAVEQYVASGQYGKDVAAMALKANKYLAKRLAKPAAPGQKLAIVFDIDETTLSNLPQMTSQDFGYVPPVWKKWIAEGRATAIVPVQILYDVALRHNVAVFFITARHESERASTEKNLRQVGYESWTKCYFVPDGYKESMRLFKTTRRQEIEAEGYTIIANIGDQESDLAGGHAEKTFKLPNPFYVVK